MKRIHYISLIGALLVGFFVRLPGVFWGYNFPTGWYGHHPDEYTHLVNTETIIAVSEEPRWPPHPYPKGMAAHVAVPVLVLHGLSGEPIFENPPTPQGIIVPGRLISVLYGTASILVVFLIARRLFKDLRIALIAAWLLAFGGLHVSQSHFFVSDISSLFWLLLGVYFLLIDIDTMSKRNLLYLSGAAACFGVSVGLKLNIAILPTLGLVAVWYHPRIRRLIQTGVFFFVGFVLVNFATYTPFEIFNTLKSGTGASFEMSWLSNVMLYLIELPSVLSFPVLLLFIFGSVYLVRRLIQEPDRRRLIPLMVVIVLPLVIYFVLVVTTVSPFPRHLVPLIPWISIVTALGLVKIIDLLSSKGIHPGLLIVPVFIYLAFFVYDGERVFLAEPRNEAAQWTLDNVAPGTTLHWGGKDWMPGFKFMAYPDQGTPEIIVIEMHHANHYLSGMGRKNSFPRDIQYMYTCCNIDTQEKIDLFQALFKGTSQYEEVARFGEGYFMPEYVLIDDLIGNRSRNYVAEVVIFKRSTELSEDEGMLP